MKKEKLFSMQDLMNWIHVEKVKHAPHQDFYGVSIDSRTVQPGDLFIGLQGQHHHGDQYIDQAIRNGASGIVCSSDGIGSYENVAIARVRDGAEALIGLARAYRETLCLPIVAVTGSCGKTTTKEMISDMCASLGSVYRSYKNYNNQIGVSLNLLRIRSHHVLACLELGTSSPGEISFLGALVKPDLGVVLNVAPAHLEKLKDLHTVSREKLSLMQYVKKGIVNLDDPYLADQTENTTKELISFGLDRNAQWRGTNLIYKENGSMQFQISYQGKSKGIFTIPFQGKHFGSNAIAAIAAAHELGVQINKLKEVNLVLPGMRGERVEKRGVTFINDSYNANPQSMSAALESYQYLKIKGKRYFVCGDMLELGVDSVRYHNELGQLLSQSGVDQLIVIGEYAKHIAEGAKKKLSQIYIFKEQIEIIQYLKDHLQSGDAVLLKGSRKLRLDEVCDSLMQALDSTPVVCL